MESTIENMRIKKDEETQTKRKKKRERGKKKENKKFDPPHRHFALSIAALEYNAQLHNKHESRVRAYLKGESLTTDLARITSRVNNNISALVEEK